MSNLDSRTLERNLAAQLAHPSEDSIWSRALEVFGNETIARAWMTTPRDIFGGRSPQQLAATGEAEQQRRVLEVLLRIDYGVFS